MVPEAQLACPELTLYMTRLPSPCKTKLVRRQGDSRYVPVLEDMKPPLLSVSPSALVGSAGMLVKIWCWAPSGYPYELL